MTAHPPRHANGDTIFPKRKGLCRVCGRPLSGRKTSFCGHACIDAYNQRISGSYLRTRVEERDKGLCAGCGLDTARLTRALEFLAGQRYGAPPWWQRVQDRLENEFMVQAERQGVSDPYNDPEWSVKWEMLKGYRKASHERLKGRHARWRALSQAKYPWAWRMGAPNWGMYVAHLWEADHIVPVAEGGGSTGLENLRTLCLPCHRGVTKELRKRLAMAKKKDEPKT